MLCFGCGCRYLAAFYAYRGADDTLVDGNYGRAGAIEFTKNEIFLTEVGVKLEESDDIVIEGMVAMCEIEVNLRVIRFFFYHGDSSVDLLSGLASGMVILICDIMLCSNIPMMLFAFFCRLHSFVVCIRLSFENRIHLEYHW